MTAHFEDFNPVAAEVRLSRMQLEKLGVAAHETHQLLEMLKNAVRLEIEANGYTSPVRKALASAVSGLIEADGLAIAREAEAAVGGAAAVVGGVHPGA